MSVKMEVKTLAQEFLDNYSLDDYQALRVALDLQKNQLLKEALLLEKKKLHPEEEKSEQGNNY